MRDFVRDALLGVCSQVKLDTEKSVLKQAAVQHLYGRLSGTLKPDANDAQLLVRPRPRHAFCTLHACWQCTTSHCKARLQASHSFFSMSASDLSCMLSMVTLYQSLCLRQAWFLDDILMRIELMSFKKQAPFVTPCMHYRGFGAKIEASNIYVPVCRQLSIQHQQCVADPEGQLKIS